jgi:Glycosyl hydrolases family 16
MADKKSFFLYAAAISLILICAIAVKMVFAANPMADLAIHIIPAPAPITNCLAGSTCPPGQWTIAQQEEFNGAGLDPNGPLTSATGVCCGSQYYIDNSGDGTGITPIFTGTTVQLRSFSNGAHGCFTDGIGPACGGNGYTWKGTTGAGYYEARIKADSSSAYKVFWTVMANGDCTGGGASLINGFEADVLEDFGGGSAQANTHWGGYGGCHMQAPLGGFADADGFHNWGVLWPDPAHNRGLTYFRDGVPIESLNGPVDTTDFIASGINGGGLHIAGRPGDANGRTLEVDWVRYYKPAGSK